MDYQDWEDQLPTSFKNDPLWRMEVYRLALWLGDIAWRDVTKLTKDGRTQRISGQLYRSVGSTSENISEGYSRSSDRDQARMYEYALGSARESRGWYWKSRHILGLAVVNHRIGLLTSIIKLLMTIIPKRRSMGVKEEKAMYGETVEELLSNVPMPD